MYVHGCDRKVTVAIRDSFAWAGVDKVYLPMIASIAESCVLCQRWYTELIDLCFPSYCSIKSLSDSKRKHIAFIDGILSAHNVTESLVHKIVSTMIESKLQSNGADSNEDAELFLSHLSIA